MEVRNSQFTAFIDMFTGNTYIMVIKMSSSNELTSSTEQFKPTKVSSALMQINIAAARKHFEKFMPDSA